MKESLEIMYFSIAKAYYASYYLYVSKTLTIAKTN